jgi:hypothetical protein
MGKMMGMMGKPLPHHLTAHRGETPAQLGFRLERTTVSALRTTVSALKT